MGHNEQLLLAHNTLVKQLYKFFDILGIAIKLLVAFGIITFLLGIMTVINVLFILYKKGILQKWLL